MVLAVTGQVSGGAGAGAGGRRTSSEEPRIVAGGGPRTRQVLQRGQTTDGADTPRGPNTRPTGCAQCWRQEFGERGMASSKLSTQNTN